MLTYFIVHWNTLEYMFVLSLGWLAGRITCYSLFKHVFTSTDDVAPCSHYTCSVCSLYSSGGCGLRLVV